MGAVVSGATVRPGRAFDAASIDWRRSRINFRLSRTGNFRPGQKILRHVEFLVTRSERRSDTHQEPGCDVRERGRTLIGQRSQAGFMDADSVARFVAASTVRTAVLDALVEENHSTRALVADLEASESAVYDAVNALAERGLLCERDDEWELTGVGFVVADALDWLAAAETTLDADRAYWRTHDVTVLPERLRRHVGALCDCEVIRATDADPNRVVREVAERIREADRIDIVSPVYQKQYAQAITPADVSARLVLDYDVVEAVRTDPPGEAQAVPNTEVRVAEAAFALGVTESEVMLSLPQCDGSYDIQSEVVAPGDRAVRWGRRLFETVWEHSVAPESVADD